MVGFHFSNGGRKCIRQILEQYQAGKIASLIQLLSIKKFHLFQYRWIHRIHSQNNGTRFSDFKLSIGTNWISLRFKTRNGWISAIQRFIFNSFFAHISLWQPKKREINMRMRKINNLIIQCSILWMISKAKL